MRRFLVLSTLLAGCGGPLSLRADGSSEPTPMVVDSGPPPKDAGMPDAGRPDAGPPPFDAGRPDAGPPPTPDAGACNGTTWSAPPCAAIDLEGKLRCIPGMKVLKDPSVANRYDLLFTQPIDHAHPDAGQFEQRLVLDHRDTARPMVLMTSGYELILYPSEPALVFGANQLNYEHRFFLDARPVPTDWSKLDIRQAAGDAHRIAEALHWLYPAAWLETGYSKGGMTAVYHRRFHPCDVNATVAYVAPTSYGATDPAYPQFLSTVGGATWAACRAAMTDFQRRLLMRRAQLVPLVVGDFSNLGGADRVFEMNVVELPFAFWQYGTPGDAFYGCSAIPGPTASDAQHFGFLTHHMPFGGLSAAELDVFAPYYYQASTQLGGPAPYEAPLKGLLLYPGANASSTFAPVGVTLPPFDAQAMPDIDAWLATGAERVMLVYGAFDPWSANGFPLGPAPRDSYRFVVPGGNHGADLGQLPFTEKKSALLALERWLGVAPLYTPMAKAGDAEARPRGFRSSPSRR